jgi:transcription termination factor Rho
MTDQSLGVLDVRERGDGFLRRREYSYLAEQGDVFVGQGAIRRFGLRTGDVIGGEVERPKGRGKGPSLARVTLVNGQSPESIVGRPEFSRLTAIHPNERLRLETDTTRGTPLAAIDRVIDLLCPFGKGQRALIVAPAKAGKTTVIQAVAAGIAANYPAAQLLLLLTDERPEEVTEMESWGYGEVVASSFDFPADRHVAIAEITLERARRRVESGGDVVLILDSITRLARAYNTVERGDGRTLSGGLGAQSLERPKRFFGSARAVDPAKGGGSLTIIGTALVDTGSKMDQVIFEEFKGTGNSELVLARDLADRRIYPAIDLVASATRKEELLLNPTELAASHALRKQIAGLPTTQGMTLVLEMLKRSPTNADLIKQMNGGS